MSSIGNVTASNGMFMVTDAKGNVQKVDLGTLMMMLKIDQTNNLDKQLEVELSEIKARNDIISSLTEFMSQCRVMKTNGIGPGECRIVGKDANGNDVWGHKTENFIKMNGEAKPGFQWANQLGTIWNDDIRVPRPSDGSDASAWDAKWDSNINSIKSKIDTLNNDSQMSNIRLQNLLEKRNNAFEMATKVMDTNNQSVASTIRNL